LTAQKTQRDEALQEIRVAYFFDRQGLPVVEWEPPGRSGTVGEFSIRTHESGSLFVEVKSPGWESELGPSQLRAGRAKEPKHKNLEGRAFAPSKIIKRSITKSYPKFRCDQPNLLVIADDLIVGLGHGTALHAQIALYRPVGSCVAERGYFTTGAFANLGAVGVFSLESYNPRITYALKVYANPCAIVRAELPSQFFDLLSN